MAALRAFAPFIAFAAIEKLAGPVPGLVAGALVSVLLLLREHLRGERSLNLLEAGSALLFTGLAVLAAAGDAQAWTLWRVRLWVDGGLVLIVLFSMCIRRPFTLHHARRHVGPELAASAAFLRAHLVLAGVWAAAFAALAAVDALMVLRPQTPVFVAVGLSAAALAAAAAFTRRARPGRAGAQAAASASQGFGAAVARRPANR